RVSNHEVRIGMMSAGRVDDRTVEGDVRERAAHTMKNLGSQGMEEMGLNLQEVLGNLPFGKKSKKRKLTVPEARRLLAQDEAEKLVDKDSVARDALERVQSNGVVFLHDVDKVVLLAGQSPAIDASRRGR